MCGGYSLVTSKTLRPILECLKEDPDVPPYLFRAYGRSGHRVQAVPHRRQVRGRLTQARSARCQNVDCYDFGHPAESRDGALAIPPGRGHLIPHRVHGCHDVFGGNLPVAGLRVKVPQVPRLDAERSANLVGDVVAELLENAPGPERDDRFCEYLVQEYGLHPPSGQDFQERVELTPQEERRDFLKIKEG